MSDSRVVLARIEDIPPERPVPLTEVHPADGRYADFGEGMYCSECGTQSARLARRDLWAVRHLPSVGRHGFVNRYCLDHLPDHEWVDGGGSRVRSRLREVECPECFMLMALGSVCDVTGQSH